jgi:hypothetical protein
MTAITSQCDTYGYKLTKPATRYSATMGKRCFSC